MSTNYTDINSRTIDSWVNGGWEWGRPITHEDYLEATKGYPGVLLTPTKKVPEEWFGSFKGKKILGLASGGGQQMPVFSALGADCTVLDYSQRQLDNERMVAEREGYSINIVHADMTKPLPFEDESFDLIFHPVSNCYIKEVQHVWNECYRILKKGGVLLAGLDNGIAFAWDDDAENMIFTLPFDPLTNPEHMKYMEECGGGVQFSHSIEEQIDGQIRAGLRLTNVFQDTDGFGKFHEHGIPTFWATRSVKD